MMWTAILVLLFLLLFTGIISLGIGKEDDNGVGMITGTVNVPESEYTMYNVGDWYPKER